MINITSTFTADILRPSLQSILKKFSEQKIQFFYNQTFQQILLPNSEFNQNEEGVNVILVRLSDLFNPLNDSAQSPEELLTALHRFNRTKRIPLLIIITPTEVKSQNDEQFYTKIENQIQLESHAWKNTLLVTSKEMLKESNLSLIFDNFTEKHGHIPYSLDFYNLMGLTIARKYSLLSRKPSKVIVLDCDGTLWNGIIEEDGINGIIIDEEYVAIQEFMIELHHAGFLLCLCSKNSESSVLNVFKNHEDIVLDLEKHICGHRINWQPKSINIQSLAQELNLGLDSFIFIDDNNIECAEVKSTIPEVFVIELPKRSNSEKNSNFNRSHFLRNIWAFDYLEKSNEDEKRTEFYKQNKLRHQLKEKSFSYEQFIKNLKIKTCIREATTNDLQRVIQLSQRTNQFNLLPNTISAVEFEHSIHNKKPHCLVIEVSDKYGEYGLVGVVAYDFHNNELIINGFFLSCRILGRGIEFEIIKHLADTASQNGISTIKLRFTKTEKNIPAINFIKQLNGQNNQEPIDHIILSIDFIKEISPEIFEQKNQSTIQNKKDSHQTNISNGFMLEIANEHFQKSMNTKESKRNITQGTDALEISILEILKQHDLWTKKTDISFIDLGIDSLKSVLIASDIYQRYQIEITPFDLLKPNYTIDKFLKLLLKEIKQTEIKAPALNLIGYDTIPLSSAQKRIWYDEKISPESRKNNIFVAYEIKGNVSKEHLKKAFKQLMARHDALRFSFSEQENQPFIILNPLESIDFKIDIFKNLANQDFGNYLKKFKHQHFDLGAAPLFRVSLAHIEKDKTIFLFCIHHIIHDGWSLNILLHDLSQLYNTLSKNIPLSITNQSSFLNFISWQRDNISEELLTKQKDFWVKQLNKMPKLELIYDKARKEGTEKQLSKRINFKISNTVTRQLKKISINNQATLYDVLITAFGLFLSHYSNQNDVNFITAVSGRHHSHVAHVIGFFVNLLLIRLHLNPDETFDALIRKNKKLLHDVFENQDFPFNEMAQLTGEQVNSKIHSFSQAGFIFQSYPINELVINNEVCKRVYSDDHAELIYDSCDECRFGNLVCYMQEFNSELHGIFEYNTLLFNKNTITHMISAFKTLLKNIAVYQDRPALSIPLLTDTQINTLFYKWNPPIINEPEHVTILNYFAEQVSAHPNKIAVKHHENTLTYEQLDKISNQLAHKLQKTMISPEMPIGIFLEKGINRIIAILGILKAGGCYVPLEIDIPAARISYIINNASISIIITSNELIPNIEEISPSVTKISITDNSIQAESDSPVDNNQFNPNQLTYILYTSGSTGTPKGVSVEQAGILRLVKNANYIKIKSSDRVAQTSSFLFDAATLEIWGALLNGATLVLIDKQTLLDEHLFSSILKNEEISILFLTTQLFHAYAYTAPYLFQHLTYLAVGGEAVLSEAIERVFQQKKRPRYFINGYGPTENTTFSTTYVVKNQRDIVNPIPIGQPLTGTQVYVLGKDMNPKPIGAPGKLYLGGVGLARGYINQPQLNQEKFITHHNKRLYDTGDIVTWQTNGHLKFIGREDNQIKINGYRIELNEIEAQLETHHLVEQAIVLVKNKDHHHQLFAYVLLQEGNSLTDINLYHYLKTFLPHYMIPNFYHQIDTVPLTENGKADKKLLAKMDLHYTSYTEYESAASLLQEKLISIYAEILRINPKNISINAEFFDIGGNSISALNLISRINDQFHVKINFSLLYEYATVKLLSEKISLLISEAHFSSTVDHAKQYENALKIIKIGSNHKTPIVFIHPIGGTGFCYLDLIKLLPNDQPCYLIQDPSIDANQILFDDIHSMAKYYNHLLLKQIKNSKFILAGYSFGGMLALEMTAQLEEKKLDDCIDFIISFDTWVVSDFMDISAKEALKASIMNQYERVAKALSNENIDPKPWMELYYCRLQDLGFAYTPPKIKKRIMLFKAQQQAGEFSAMNDATNFLSLHSAKEIDVYLTPGNHDSILQFPNVRYISDTLHNYFADTLNELDC
ncbi:non-ribosomal peptide synthetase [Legionella fallonii]|uniref:Uncharacterized protein n=1 Tax=Legionella fallonii LLAP-10 TaxID=1212491 RepID=A0A098G2Y5_9GAMM|nr:non-ribosomal peptide synthetase [Legionella fallonii]CEG56818.1 conserved protein of unknown function [Legionella fallonii LLAP-10]